MAMQTIKCPNCGANIEIDDIRDTFYCTYCGSPIQRDPDNTFTYRTVDVAKIKEIESNERIKIKQMEDDKKFDFSSFVIGFATIASIGALVFIFITSYYSERKEEQRLQGIVTEIQQDIMSGDYDAALIKANGLHMSENSWANNKTEEIERWNQQREELIELIEKKKKESGNK